MTAIIGTAWLAGAAVALPAAAQDVAPDALVKNVTLEVVDLIS